MNRAILSGLLVVAALLLTVPASAERASLAATPSVITSPNGHSRVLLSVPSLAEYREEWVSSATLVLDLAPGTLPGDVELLIDAVGTYWAGGASWMSPWTRPGGDVVGQTGGGGSLGRGPAPGRLRVDVTHAVRGMAEGDLEENGLIVYPSDPGKPGFTAAEMQVLGVSSATLEVHVRVFDVAGRQVKELVHGRMAPGRHSVPWNGLSDQGQRTAAGVYFVVVDTSGFRATSKIVRVGR